MLHIIVTESLTVSAAYYSSDILIGAICCRVETNKAEGTTKLYVMTIGVLQPYRHLGVGKPRSG